MFIYLLFISSRRTFCKQHLMWVHTKQVTNCWLRFLSRPILWTIAYIVLYHQSYLLSILRTVGYSGTLSQATCINRQTTGHMRWYFMAHLLYLQFSAVFAVSSVYTQIANWLLWTLNPHRLSFRLNWANVWSKLNAKPVSRWLPNLAAFSARRLINRGIATVNISAKISYWNRRITC